MPAWMDQYRIKFDDSGGDGRYRYLVPGEDFYRNGYSSTFATGGFWLLFKLDEKRILQLQFKVCKDKEGKKIGQLYDEDGNEYKGGNKQAAFTLDLLLKFLSNPTYSTVLEHMAGRTSERVEMGINYDERNNPLGNDFMPDPHDGNRTDIWAAVTINPNSPDESYVSIGAQILASDFVNSGGDIEAAGGTFDGMNIFQSEMTTSMPWREKGSSGREWDLHGQGLSGSAQPCPEPDTGPSPPPFNKP